MFPLKAQVRNGRIILDAPTDLAEGTELDLVPTDDQDAPDAEDRARLHAALLQSEEDVTAGRTRPAGDFLSDLRRTK